MNDKRLSHLIDKEDQLGEDFIEIRGLKVSGKVGVPEGERAHPQTLKIDLRFAPVRSFAEMDDQLQDSVDYVAIAQYLKTRTHEGERRLIETLAKDLACGLIENFPLLWVEITVKKFILSDADWVSVKTIVKK